MCNKETTVHVAAGINDMLCNRFSVSSAFRSSGMG